MVPRVRRVHQDYQDPQEQQEPQEHQEHQEYQVREQVALLLPIVTNVSYNVFLFIQAKKRLGLRTSIVFLKGARSHYFR